MGAISLVDCHCGKIDAGELRSLQVKNHQNTARKSTYFRLVCVKADVTRPMDNVEIHWLFVNELKPYGSALREASDKSKHIVNVNFGKFCMF